MLWSYAKLESSNLVLFKAAGDLIVVKHDLSEFWPQNLSNILWAYATAGESHPQLYKKLGNHIIAMKDLGQFKPQELSNLIWAYATAGESHPQLFSKFGDHIVTMRDLGQFKPQELSNLIWAYATTFQSHPLLFQKLAHVATSRSKGFTSQGIANLLWAYAIVRQTELHLFTSFAPAVKSILDKCNSQNIANIAWSYSVANVNDHSIFNTDFVDLCQARANDFTSDGYSQLHQWQLWQEEIKSGINLPQALREKCRKAFLLRLPQPSRLQNDVISVLSSIGMSPEEEVLTLSGYRLDAIVEVNGEKVGIEVDGPTHFMNQEPTGSTLLKRRQVNNLDNICIVSVPYWEWNKLERDRAKKQEYLRSKLDAKLLSVGVSSHHELSISNAGELHAISTKHSQLLQGRRQAPTSSGLAASRSEWQTCQQQGERARGEVRYPNNDGGHASNTAVLTDINYVNRKQLRPTEHSYDQARKRSRRV
jgi:hypothetical protein